MRLVRLMAFLGALVAATACQAETLTYLDLIKKLTSLESLATLPKPGEKCAQASSWDRASRIDANGVYTNWDANGDNNGIIRREDGKEVMAEIEGPGIIWRTWSAAPGKGHVRVYLDGAAEPAIDMAFQDWFNNTNRPFVYPALVHDASSGKNAYIPIPFQKSCKITADPDWGAYYHFTYTTYPKDTVLPTFKRSLTGDEMEALEQANAKLTTGLGTDPSGIRPGEATSRKRITLKPGQSARTIGLRGQGAITAIRIKVGLGDRADEITALRELALKITFDGETKPSVWSPLGDFFGTAPGLNKYRSLPLGITDDGMYCFWYMPYGKGASVELINDGKSARKLEIAVTHAPLTQPLDTLARFHAKWHRDALLPTEKERWIDWTMLKTEGIGRFAGVQLHVWNPKGSWWGEGDEKFHVDGEKFPSTFGTGSEDYFGYAWCNPTRFENAYHNQPFNSGNNRGHASVNRWHVVDNVAFQTSFEGYIEKYYANDRPTLYAATAYWYLKSGGHDPYEPAPMSDRLGYFDMNLPEPMAVKGAVEGEKMKVLDVSAGKTEPQDMSGFGESWSRGSQLWWTECKPGSKLTLALPVAKAGQYSVSVNLTRAVDYGICQLWLDDRKLGEPIDCYNNGVVPTGAIDLGTVSLSAGEHRLVAEIVGTSDKGVKGYMFGLDYVKLEGK